MIQQLYDILDKNGIVMPRYHNGKGRTEDQAKRILSSLNKNGEYRPYTMQVIK